jgi:hypothetical protein
MTPDERNDLNARLDDIAGMQIALMNTLASLFVMLPPETKAIVTSHLPKMDDALAGTLLASRFSDRTIDTAERVYRQLTATLR